MAKTLSIGDALVAFLRDSALEKPLLERQVIELWPELMGPTIGKMTRSVEMKDGVLVIRLSSAALRSELFECRKDLVRKLNEKIGAEVVNDVRLLG